MKIHLRLTSLLLAALPAIATAQDDTGGEDGRLSGEVLTCQSLSSASRTRAACGEVEQNVLRVERELTTFSASVELKSRQCSTEITVDYVQRDVIARVNGLIENKTCAASSGHYRIAVRVKDEDGELKDLEFSEEWQRDDDQPVAFTADYSIGENVELIRLRSLGARCTCSDTAEE